MTQGQGLWMRRGAPRNLEIEPLVAFAPNGRPALAQPNEQVQMLRGFVDSPFNGHVHAALYVKRDGAVTGVDLGMTGPSLLQTPTVSACPALIL